MKWLPGDVLLKNEGQRKYVVEVRLQEVVPGGLQLHFDSILAPYISGNRHIVRVKGKCEH